MIYNLVVNYIRISWFMLIFAHMDTEHLSFSYITRVMEGAAKGNVKGNE